MKKALSLQESSFPLAILLLINFFVLSTINSYSQAPADFTGTWKFDESKSTVLPDMISETLVITQKGNDITINRTFVRKGAKPLISTFNYTIGGRTKSKSKTGTEIVTSS